MSRLLLVLTLSSLLLMYPGWAEPLRICRPNNMVSVLGYIAEEIGAFSDHELQIEFLTATNGKLCQDTILAGDADLAFTGEAPFVFASVADAPLRVIAQLGENSETAVTIRTDRGIVSAADLRGKRVAYLPGTVSYFYLVRLLAKHGISLDELNLVSMQPPVMSQALIGGSIDAMVMWEPWGMNARLGLGSNGTTLRDSEVYRYRPLLVGSTDTIKNRSEDLKNALRALIVAQAFAHRHPLQSQRKVAPHIALTAEQLEGIWDLSKIEVSASESLIPLMQDHISWLRRTSEAHRDIIVPPFPQLVDYSLLSAAKEQP